MNFCTVLGDEHAATRHRATILTMPALDTSPQIEEMQFEIWRSMTGEQRLLRCLEISLLVREFAKAGIRSEHPEWSEKDVMREIFRRAFLPKPMPDWVP